MTTQEVKIKEEENDESFLKQKREREEIVKEEEKDNENDNNTQKIPNLEDSIPKKEETSIKEEQKPEIVEPDIYVPLVSISVFNELQKAPLSETELEEEYSKYKNKHLEHKLGLFYKDHKDDEWFKELYDPQTIQESKNERHLQCVRLHENFLLKLRETNNYSSLNLTLSDHDKERIINHPVLKLKYHLFKQNEEFISPANPKTDSKDLIDITKEPYYAFNPDDFTVFLNEIPKTISRSQIISAISNIGNYLSVSMSTPNRLKNYSRYCWITFSTQEKCELAMTMLKECKITDDFMIFPYISKSLTSKYVRLTPRLFTNRIEEDNELLKKITALLDKENNLSENKVLSIINSFPLEKQNDILMLYLRHVHGFCYYCIEEFEDERNLAVKCDCIHLRDYGSLGSREEAGDNLEIEKEFDEKLTEKIKLFMQKKEKILSEDTSFLTELNAIKESFFASQIKMLVENEKYQCVICGKLFMGSDYVLKHINNKHVEIIKENVENGFYEKKRRENYFKMRKENYVEDHNLIKTVDEYKEALENRANRKRMKMNNEDGGEKGTSSGSTANKSDDDRQRRKIYKDYDSIENRKQKDKKIISYDEL